MTPGASCPGLFYCPLPLREFVAPIPDMVACDGGVALLFVSVEPPVRYLSIL